MFLQYVLYFLHGTINMDFKFDWAQFFSSDISHQLSSYQETERSFMAAYLVYVVIYNSFVNELPTRKDVDVNVEPIQFWYPIVCKHKASYFIYQFHDAFLRRHRELFIREAPTPVTKEAIDFLRGKGKFYIDDEHTYFRLYGFEGTPFLFPRFANN